MKKIILLIVALLPIVGFSQVDLATWALTSNGNAVNNTYVTTSFTKGSGVSTVSYSSNGAEASEWTANGSLDTDDYYEATITPTTGERLYISTLSLTHTKIDNGNGNGNAGPANYSIRYYKSTNTGSVTTLITGATSTSGKIDNDLAIGTYLNSGESLVIRMYGYNSGSNGSGKWRINANSLKIKGFQRLCGDYTIATASVVPFKTLTTAIEAVNNLGVSCATRFLVDENQTTTTQYVINQFTGTSATNTLTIKPNTGKTVSVTGNNPNGYTGIPSVIIFNGADNVIIDGSNTANGTTKDLTISNNDNINYISKSIVWVASNGSNAATYITVKNSILNMVNRNQDGIILSGVYSGNYSIGGNNTTSVAESTASNSYITINNNTLVNLREGIYVNGNASSSIIPQNWAVTSNIIGSSVDSQKPIMGVYLKNVKDYQVNNNTISGIRRTTNGNSYNCAAILAVGSSNGFIYSNNISDVYSNLNEDKSRCGIYLESGNNTIYNNFITNIRGGDTDNNDYNYYLKGHGIYIRSGANNKIYYNTIHMNSTSVGGRSSCLYIYGGTAVDVRNNIFYNTQSTGTQYAVYSNIANTELTSNYNDFFVTGATTNMPVRSGNSEYASVASWNTASSKDANSVSFAPVFSTSLYLNTTSTTNDGLQGIAISGITTDIDGETRTKPYIGADEVVAACTPIGDPTVYGDNTWNVYGYDQNSFTLNSANYKGYYTQSTLGIDTTTAWSLNNSPSTATVSGTNTVWQGCSLGDDYFTFVYKRKGFPAGSYELRMVGWDDDARVYVDGVEVQPDDFIGWSGNTDQNILAGTFCLNANSTIEIITVEYGGDAKLKMNLIATSAIYNNGWTGTAEGNSIEIQSDLMINSDLEVCTCTVKSGSVLTIKDNKSLVVQDAIVVETGGTLIVENNANLVQVNDTAASSNSGSIQVERESSPVKQYDYVYWSSPVVGTTMQTLSNPSMYYRFNTLTNSWAWMSASDIMQKGVGYIARVSNYLNFNGPQSPTVLATFNGAQHSGVVNVDVNGTNTTKFNLIGNPYPSAIDAEAFILANASKITGTLYIWTHQTAISSNTSGSEANNYTSDDYAKFNLVGGVGTGLPANSNASVAPNGYIPSCQGFYVETTSNGAQQLLFNNSMRVAGVNTNNQFFKPAPTETDQTIYKHRVWLNISNTQGAYCETLLGYVTGATNELDNLYDGKTVPAGNYVSLYSILGTQPLSIQGRGLPFSDTDIIPLGYSTTITGNLTISLGQFDGLFDGQDVFLVDNTNNVYTNLKDINYTFQTATGTFTDRFELRFVNETLGIENPTIDQNAMMVIRNGNQIQVKSNELTIDQVIVYDLQGRVIFDKKNINAQEFFTGQLNASNQVVIVKVIADNDAELVKKVIMN